MIILLIVFVTLLALVFIFTPREGPGVMTRKGEQYEDPDR